MVIIETETGFMIKNPVSASALNPKINQGTAAENATHEVASASGLPDFVYKSEILKVGSGTREVSDGIILVGNIGLILQVKSREKPSIESKKEASWIDKSIARAVSQGKGTLRSLLGKNTIVLTNMRERNMEITAQDYQWLIVVIIDHPNPPQGVDFSFDDGVHSVVVLLRREWEFLFDQLKSTHAVANYCQRTANKKLSWVKRSNVTTDWRQLTLKPRQLRSTLH